MPFSGHKKNVPTCSVEDSSRLEATFVRDLLLGLMEITDGQRYFPL